MRFSENTALEGVRLGMFELELLAWMSHQFDAMPKAGDDFKFPADYFPILTPMMFDTGLVDNRRTERQGGRCICSVTQKGVDLIAEFRLLKILHDV